MKDLLFRRVTTSYPVFVVVILISSYQSDRVVPALQSMRIFERLLKDERKGQFIVFVVGQRGDREPASLPTTRKVCLSRSRLA